MFRTVTPSIIRSLRLYIQHYTIQVLWLLASKQPQNLYDIYLMLYVQSQTPDDGQSDKQPQNLYDLYLMLYVQS